jgi:ribonucleotide reductase alpha subunit
MFCVKPVNHIILLNANSTEIMAHLRECYDFNTLGNIVRWIVMNLNMVIDNNFYPLDEFDSKTGQITKRGKIATTNYKSRPLGIGVSGFSDMLARLDLPFCKDDKGREIHPAVELLNKMVFACIEFNGLIKSCELALTHGPYETFIHEDKKCPYAEGKFQHDLWADEYKVLEKLRSESGIKRNWVRKPEDDIPVSPSDWGQHRIVITGVRDSEHTVISVSTEIEPSWESLRKNIVLHGIYNSLITALMPTASTSQIIGNCESTEAHMSIVYAREVKSGFYIITNEYLCRDLQSIGLLKDDILNNIRNNWDGTLSGIVDYVAKTYKDFKDFDRLNHIRRKYMTAYELSNRIFMKMASDRGRYVDQSQSLNVFLPKVSTEALSALLYYGYDLGLKTVMYYLYQKKFSSIAKFGELAAITNDSKVDTKLESKIESKLESDVKVSETKNIVESDSLALTPAEICRRDALTGKKICEMCT